MPPWLLLLAGYLVGAIPFGLLVAKWWAGIDVREHGSGNIGATNVYRVVGRPAGLLVLVLDVGKGLWPPLAARALGWDAAWQIGAGLAAFFGHSLSPFLGFKGGKGVATALGVLLGIAWPVALTAWALWGVVVLLSGYVSLASILAAIALTPLTLYFYPGDRARLAFVIIVGLVGLHKHRANIRRLLDGTENRFGRPRPPEAPNEQSPPS